MVIQPANQGQFPLDVVQAAWTRTLKSRRWGLTRAMGEILHEEEQLAVGAGSGVFVAFRDFQDMSDEQRTKKVEELIRDRENSLLAALTATQRTRSSN